MESFLNTIVLVLLLGGAMFGLILAGAIVVICIEMLKD